MSAILLLINSHENRLLLTKLLEKEHDVHAPDPSSEAGFAALGQGAFDLCILDGPVLNRYWKTVALRKRETPDDFLPFLLVTSQTRVRSTTRALWRLIDGVLLTPIEKHELKARVAVLLRAQQYPRRLNKRYATLAQVAPVGIVMLDREGTVTYANPEAEQILETGLDTLLGRTIDSWHVTDFEGTPYPEDQRLFHRIVRQKQGLRNVSYAVGQGTDHRVLLSVNGAPLFDEAGDLEAVLCSIVDVTEREQRTLELKQAKEEAEEMNRLKDAFLSNMSHEIRTPLAGIIGFADLLARSEIEDPSSYAQEIKLSGERLLQTLNSVLDLAMLEAGTIDVKLRPYDVGVEVRKACRVALPLAQKKGLTLQVEAPSAPVEALVDPAALSRILDNLIGNAIKFTKHGEVRVRARATSGQIEVFVEDTGIGIDETFQAHLFEAFKQESVGLSRSYEGTGLGLTIVKRLVNLQGGHIDVQSRKGVGTTFKVSFPRGASGDETHEAAIPVQHGDSVPWARVLVAEDDAAMQFLLRHIIEQMPQVKSAEITGDIGEALTLAQQQRFDVLVLDINLRSRRTGTDVLHILRRNPQYGDVPAVAMTAYAMPGDKEQLLEAGFDAYVAKPFRSEMLHQTIEALLQRGHTQPSDTHPKDLS